MTTCNGDCNQGRDCRCAPDVTIDDNGHWVAHGVFTVHRATFEMGWNAAIDAAAKACKESDRYRGDYFAIKVEELKK